MLKTYPEPAKTYDRSTFYEIQKRANCEKVQFLNSMWLRNIAEEIKI